MLYTCSILLSVGYAAGAAISTVTTTYVTSQVPDYFQTTPEIFQGPTPTGPEPFLRQTDQAPFSGVKYEPPHPIETQQPIEGAPAGANIFQLLGNISPYFPSPGFGVDEYPLPEGAEIVWLNMISRHGARYPTEDIPIGDALPSWNDAKFSGNLSWLNQWEYSLGTNILTPSGREELYNSGVLHVYDYGHLFDPKSDKKILARTTTEDRMRKSAENFMAGFFGLGYADYVDLEFIIDLEGYNNSLAGYYACPNNDNLRTSAGTNISEAWIEQYTANAVKRFNAATDGFTWNATSIYYAQQLCSYETVALGYSRWCALFNYQEWLDFEYSIDLDFAGTYGFQSPTGRAVGIGYVEEVLAKINHQLITEPTGSINVTLDSMESTFPTNQALNFDFSHEVNIFGILTAFGLKQFAPLLPADRYEPDRQLIVSHMTPFATRLDIELIKTPQPVSTRRLSKRTEYAQGGETTYIHFILNQRTIPLGESIPVCGQRADGWCELNTFLDFQADALEQSQYDYACNGDYAPPAWGEVNNGAPL